jgi:capsule polysaccharide export protein KpsE/RkpR
MSHRLLILLLFSAALTVGCRSKSTVETQRDEAASAELAKAKTETKAAAHAMADYAYTRKAEFIATMNKELVALQEDLDRLSAKVESSAGAVKVEATAKIETVREKLSQTKKLLAQTGSATESTWNGATGLARQSYASLKDSIEETRRWLSDKIAP